LLQAAEVGVHDGAVPVEGEDQCNVDADSLAGHLRDRGESFLSGRDLDEQVVAVHCAAQCPCRAGGRAGVAGQPGVDFDGDAAVPASGLLVDGSEDVTGGADVVGGDGEDRGVHVGAPLSEVAQLVVVAMALGQG